MIRGRLPVKAIDLVSYNLCKDLINKDIKVTNVGVRNKINILKQSLPGIKKISFFKERNPGVRI